MYRYPTEHKDPLESHHLWKDQRTSLMRHLEPMCSPEDCSGAPGDIISLATSTDRTYPAQPVPLQTAKRRLDATIASRLVAVRLLAEEISDRLEAAPDRT